MRPTITVRAILTGVAVVLLALVSSVAWAAPAAAHGDKDRLEEMRLEPASLPVAPLLTSPNVRHLSANPGQLGISGCFLQTAPLFVTSGLDSLRVLDVSDGPRPEWSAPSRRCSSRTRR